MIAEALRIPVVRIPVALGLGGLAFTLGFIRLVVMSARFTVRLLRGASPATALSDLARRGPVP